MTRGLVATTVLLWFVVLIKIVYHVWTVDCVPGPSLVCNKAGVIVPFGRKLRPTGHFLISSRASM